MTIKLFLKSALKYRKLARQYEQLFCNQCTQNELLRESILHRRKADFETRLELLQIKNVLKDRERELMRVQVENSDFENVIALQEREIKGLKEPFKIIEKTEE